MNPDRTLSATFWAMLAVQTLGSVDLTAGPNGAKARKLPAPKAYVAIVVLWSLFNFAAGTRAARAAAHLSLLVLATAMVAGPFGKRFLHFLNTVAQLFSLAPASPGGGLSALAPSPGSTTPGGLIA